MDSLRNRLLFIFGLSLLSVYLVSPTVFYFSAPKEKRNDGAYFANLVPDWLPKKHVKLGLDLQGGVQLVLGVDTKVAIDNKLGRMGTEITRWANQPKKQVRTAYVEKGQQTLKIDFEEDVDIGDFKAKLREDYTGLVEVDREGSTVFFKYDDAQLKSIKQAALNQAERVVRNRVDKWGVSEPSITRRIDGTILVQLPGFKDPSKARELLGRTAQLQFKLLNEDSDAFESLTVNLPPGISFSRRGNFKAISFTSEDKQSIIDLTKSKIPEGSELLFEEEEIAGGKKRRFTSHLLFAANELSGEDVLDAITGTDASSFDNRPIVSLKFTGQGGKRFGEITGDNIQRRMAIVLDNTVVSDPVIQAKIPSGSAQITLGSGSYQEQIQEAQDLSLILKSGALPAPITILEERQVGATLGPELANQGIFSVCLGLVVVLFYMLVFYKRPGLLSCVALLLNGLFLIAGMGLFGFALTFPGFAGFILTLGMGVDANVLINERIRQELRDGKGAKKAIESGFQKVFWTIIDANVTTLIAAIVLLETNSSGPIKGFSVALIIGLLVSMFTSLFCTKAFFTFVVAGQKSDQQVRKWLGAGKGDFKWNLDFLRFGKLATIIGGVLALAVMIGGATRGMNWSVDFAGGTELEVLFDKEIESSQIRGALIESGIDSPTLQTIGEGGKRFLVRFEKNLAKEKEGIRQIFASKLSSYGPDIQRVDFVGPLIGKELRTQGMMSVGWAILGVLIYIGLRFDMRFGPGAVYKMVQDVFIIIGFYIVFQRSFDLTSVAALLTVVGYSVNDTIVIYDRIRENLSIHPRSSLAENINLSVNETLTRTINTSVTTILALAGVLVFGSAQIWNFAAAMVVGVISATLTSTFIATTVLVWMHKWKNRTSKAAA